MSYGGDKTSAKISDHDSVYLLRLTNRWNPDRVKEYSLWLDPNPVRDKW